MKFSALLMVFFLAFAAFGQSQPLTGSIQGVVMDKTADEPMPFATVVIKGTTKGSTTDIDGNFVIPGLEPGTYTLVVSFVGYDPMEKDFVVIAGENTERT